MPAHAILVAGLGFGDEGKGTIVDYLTRVHGASVVIRYNGGPQAGHNVVTTDGRHHTFSQFGSGTLAGARTHLSRFMLIEPFALVKEAEHLVELGVPQPFEGLSIDRRALLVTPYHAAVNRLRELSLRHGSCGMGVGETARFALEHPAYALSAADLCGFGTDRLVQPLELELVRLTLCDETAKLRALLRDTPRAAPELALLEDSASAAVLAERYRRLPHGLLSSIFPWRHTERVLADERTVIFEGAQGVLLDENYGFHPYTTWSRCTFQNAYELGAPDHVALWRDVRRIGVTRSYTTRHGPGPMPTEDGGSTFAGIAEPHNESAGWQGSFRRGPLDLVLLQYALEAIGGADEIAMTHLDHSRYGARRSASFQLQTCLSYDMLHGGDILAAGGPIGPDGSPERLASQQRLGMALMDARPHDIVVRSPASIADRLETPISLISQGPTAAEKGPYA